MAERIILSGPEQVIRPMITHLMGIHMLIKNRDVGCWVGHSLEELTRSVPQSLSLTIFFHNNRYPPFIRRKGVRRVGDVRTVRAECKVPFANPASMNWTTIKAACGGADGYNWGNWLATAKMSLPDGEAIKFMHVYGATKAGAKAQLESLATLSRCQILKLDASDQGIAGTQINNKSIKKSSINVFPSYCTLINQKKIAAETEGYGTLSGTYSRAEARINLWPPSEPPDAAEIIRECLRTPSPTNV